MRVIVSQAKRVPIKSSRTVEFHDAEKIREDSSLDQCVDKVDTMSQQNAQFLASVDKDSLLRNFVAQMDAYAGLFKEMNAIRQPKLDVSRLTGPSEMERLFNNQAQMIVELQNQVHNLTVYQVNRQKSLEEQKQQRQAHQVVQESTVKVVEITRRPQSENVETEIGSTNDLPSLCASTQMNSLGFDSVQAHTRPYTQKRVITRSIGKVPLDADGAGQLKKVSQHSGQANRLAKLNSSSRKRTKQTRSNIRVKRGVDIAAEKAPAIVRKKTKTYLCEVCGQGFLSNGHLIRHLKIHSGAKPFECLVCNVAFSRKDHLSRHSLMHVIEKPFECNICNGSFRRKDHLSNHMNIHSGRRPYQCNVCKKAFRKSSHLSRHRRVHAKDK